MSTPHNPAITRKSRRAGIGDALERANAAKPGLLKKRGAVLDRSGNLHDAAYEQLRNALMDGHFKPGQTFTIRAVASVFGTSPMPVRDALKRLVAEHALQLLPSRSVVLPVMTRARFQEILQIRLSLESMLAARAATKVTPAVIDAMAADHKAMCQALAAGQTAEYLASNRRFHFRLYEAAQTVVMQPVVETMWMQIGPHLNQLFSSRERAVSDVDHHHKDLLRALRRQDAPAAAKAIWNDLSAAADAILDANQFEEQS